MSSDEELAKDLGLLSAMTIGIGTMIGAGIFVLPGEAARAAGPAVVASFVIGGLIALINAMAVSELGTAMPKAGGGYYYVNRGLGPLFGSITGLGDWMGLAFASAFYCIGFGGYLAELLDGTMFALPTLVLGPVIITEIQIGAVIAGIIFVGVNYIGAKETGGLQTVIVFILLGILTIFAVTGWLSFDWGTLVVDGWTPQGSAAILPATGLVFVSFLGYAKIATVAEEMKNPGRNLPIAVIGSVAIVTVIYAILVAIMVGVVPWNRLDENVPVSDVAEVTFAGLPVLGVVGVTLITLAALLATASSANASILSSARINFAMGRDEIVTDWLNEIHPRFATPYRSILVTGGLILVFILAFGRDLRILATAASVLHLIVYALMNLALIAFREADVPEYDPSFTVPLYPITPILGAGCSLGLIYFIPVEAQILSVLFVLGAVIWYYLYARKHTPIVGAIERYILDHPDEVPSAAVEVAERTVPDGRGPYRILVPLANPETERSLIELATRIASQYPAGEINAVHMVQVPDQTPLTVATDRFEEESEPLLEQARDHAKAVDPDVEIHTTSIASHDPFNTIYGRARTMDADLIIMGWGGRRAWTSGTADRRLRDLRRRLPADILALKDRGLATDRILLPTAGGPDSKLSAEIARALQSSAESTVSLLHVVNSPEERADGEAFLRAWAGDHDLAAVDFIIETDGDVEGAVIDHAADHTLVVLGATGRGLLSRLLTDSLHSEIVESVECSVVLAERPAGESLIRRLFKFR